mgnify:CR=1 FL=1
MKKRGVLFFLALVLMIISLQNVSALGISPAFREYNFEPGLEGKISYIVFGSEDVEYGVFVTGDLAPYVKLSKTIVRGGDSFDVDFKLPDVIETPGLNRIRVHVAEKIDPELAGGFIGTRIVVISQIDIYVPYPGRYLQVFLRGHDVNLGEPVRFELDINSEGKEDVTVTPLIEIFSETGEQKETLYFAEKEIASQEQLKLQKYLNTSSYNPGNYKAIAIVDYGVIAQSEVFFRIGELRVDIEGYTSKLYAGKLQKFDIGVASGWNDAIAGVYADVVLFNDTNDNLISFKTSTTGLIPWETRNITGYIDTAGFQPGVYNANITLFYFGKEEGRSTNKVVKVEIVEPPSSATWYIVGGIGLLIIIVITAIKIFKKNGSKKRKK